MPSRKPARKRGMKNPTGKKSETPKSGKVKPPYRRKSWDTKGKWESDNAGSEWG